MSEPRGFIPDAIDYATAIAGGRIEACLYARQACERFLRDLDEAAHPGSEWAFEPDLATRAMLFASQMPNIKGPEAGRAIRLMQWQRLAYANIFGFIERATGARRFRQAAVFVPKGNGKTTISAPLAMYLTFGEGEGGAEGYAAAVTRDQARILFEVAQNMVRRSRMMQREWQVGVLTNSIFQSETASKFLPISSDAKALDGLNVQCAVCDEIGSHRTPEVYDALNTAMGKRRQPFLLSISTATANTAGIGKQLWDYLVRLLSQSQVDDRFWGVIYTIDDGDDPWTEETWIKANPGWGQSVQPDAPAEPRRDPWKGIKERRGVRAARYVIALLRNQKNRDTHEQTAQWILTRFGDDVVMREYQEKALNYTATGEGGALIPQDFMADLIELLRAQTAVRGANPMEVGMPMGNLTIPRLAGGATAGYQDELDDIAISQEQFDDVNFVAKKLTAMVPVSNDLIRRAPVGVEEIVRDDLVQTIARREDLAFLRGDGSDKGPVGMRSLVLPANLITVTAMPATPGPGDQVTAILDGASAAILALQNGMSRMIRPTWIMAPTISRFIATARDQVGNWYWKAEIESGRFEGYPFKLTQQIPTNLVFGTYTKGSEVYFVDMADFIIADTYNVIVDASDVAAYNDGTGTMVSAFQRDQSLFRVIAEHDVNMRHLQSLVVLQTQDWGFSGVPGSAGAPYSTQPLNPTWSQAGAIRPAVLTGADAPPALTDPA